MTSLPRTDRTAALIAGGLALICLVVALALPSDAFLSSRDTDLVSEFVSWRAYLADSLRHGYLPLWNPYTYGGQPFLGGFESAVLYPPNLLFLCLPLAPALNFSMLLHLVILGWGMERWATFRGLNSWAAALAGLVMPLSGAVFPHIYAGHVSNICTMAWAPWLFLGLESWITQSQRRGLLLASAAICLQILAGHIQYFFYTAVAVGIYAVVLTVAEPNLRRRALPAVVISYVAAIALGAAQLLPGLAASSEGIRQDKLEYPFASMFGFPPENLLTLIAPGFFGSLGTPVYWGRCYLWEMTLFIGAVGPLLIAIAVLDAGPRRRRVLLDLIVAGFLLVLALGVHTPVFDLLYGYAPGFGHFRSWSKFIFPATLFLVQVLATGADALLSGKKIPRGLAWTGLLTGLCAGGVGLVILAQPDSMGGLLSFIASTKESYVPPEAFTQADFISEAAGHAALSLILAGFILVLAGGSLLNLGKHPLRRWVLPALLVAEMIGFVAGQIKISHYRDVIPDELRQFIVAHPGDYRVFDVARADNGFLLGAGDISGNNPSVLKRYAEFINFTQGSDPDHATQYLPIHNIPPLYALLRYRYAFLPGREGFSVAESPVPPLPHLLLISDAKVLNGRDAIFAAMKDTAFQPGDTALLETEPRPSPEPGAKGSVKLISDRPDEMVIEADTDKPALLLITDLYDHNWRAEAMPDSSQKSYNLMPADYILRAVPLAAGHHHFKIVYAPVAFTLGVTISVVAWACWIGLFFWLRPEIKS